MKYRVYATKPRSVFRLQAEIERMIGDIGPQMCEKVISNFEERINSCRLSVGGRIADVVFHTKMGELTVDKYAIIVGIRFL